MLPWIHDLKDYAIFLDLDGTVLEIADHPDDVHAPPATLRLLQELREKSNAALAVISGRELSVIDRLLEPLKLPAAGVHGLERRDSAGVLHRSEVIDVQNVSFVLEKVLGDETGIVIERKPGAVALHYRMRPELERRCCEVVREVVGMRADLSLVHGKMVFEILQKGLEKGDVIGAFLKEPPFEGRIPIFAGDDATDETGFAVVNSKGGISIKVGSQNTAARFRARDVQELGEWLAALAADTGGRRND